MTALDIKIGSTSFSVPAQDSKGRPIGSNRVLAMAAQQLKYYSDRLAAQVDAVKQDTDRLNALQTTLSSMAGWTAANWRADPIGYTAMLSAAGVDLSGTWQRVSALVSPELNDFRRMAEAQITPGQHFDLAALGDASAGPLDPALQFDGAKYSFLKMGAGVVYVDHVQNYVVTVTDAQLDTWRKQVAANADLLTQSSQSRQAFLQDLASSVQSFLLFTTNFQERNERTRQSILDHVA